MRKSALLIVSALLLSAAAPYSNDRLANGFAYFVSTGRDVSVFMSGAVPDDVTAQLKLLAGCKVVSVDSLNAKFVGYGIEWRCRKKPKGMKTAVMVKIADGMIYQVEMSDVL